ncbi:hypothetical protein FQA47_006863 [Oryzias melastigma]|uniref:Uncharacterized protein n=1 Tax=Oryzias melastigma TaxID=30732 RepID=A0A834CJ72_ORYME|nr:hypothetical protein FQA47_006863 [Oryzias melastigma]
MGCSRKLSADRQTDRQTDIWTCHSSQVLEISGTESVFFHGSFCVDSPESFQPSTLFFLQPICLFSFCD